MRRVRWTRIEIGINQKYEILNIGYTTPKVNILKVNMKKRIVEDGVKKIMGMKEKYNTRAEKEIIGLPMDV